jgi:hypothetical protein
MRETFRSDPVTRCRPFPVPNLTRLCQNGYLIGKVKLAQDSNVDASAVVTHQYYTAYKFFLNRIAHGISFFNQ